MNLWIRFLLLLVLTGGTAAVSAQLNTRLKKKDRRKDIEMVTDKGTIILRLHDETPQHRDNFLRLVKRGHYDGMLFHRVIRNFMIQSGDPNSRKATAGQQLGDGDLSYDLPAEFHPTLFHRKGALAAAREGDQTNPQKKSSASQFYIVQGKTFTDSMMDSVEIARLQGRKISEEYRQVYRTVGGTPQLDQNYTVFGYVVSGLDVVDSIAVTPTSKTPPDRPLTDVRIIRARLVKRR